MKKCLRIAALLLAMCLLAGCTSGDLDKSFTCRELTMTVPVIMKDVSDQDEFASFTFALDSSLVAIFGLNETFEEYPVLKDYDTQDYAQLIISGNSLDALVTERLNQDYHYFVYSADTEDGEYTYVVGIFENDNGFWMIQMCSPSKLMDREDCLEYLDSVTFS